jgi:thiamine-phosphate diphosphorylase
VITLTLVSDGRNPEGLPALVARAARAGVDHVQVREKHLLGRALRDLVCEVVGAVAGTTTLVFVNGRPDVAEATGAHGVQLPEEGLPVGEVKHAFPGLRVGASRHSVEAAARAEEEGADFVTLGPIFSTPGKEPLGAHALSLAARRLRIPVHAIGGIDLETAKIAVAAGARGLMAIRLFLSGSLEATVGSLKGL